MILVILMMMRLMMMMMMMLKLVLFITEAGDEPLWTAVTQVMHFGRSSGNSS